MYIILIYSHHQTERKYKWMSAMGTIRRKYTLLNINMITYGHEGEARETRLDLFTRRCSYPRHSFAPQSCISDLCLVSSQVAAL